MNECSRTLSGLHVFKPRSAVRTKPYTGFVPEWDEGEQFVSRLRYVRDAPMRVVATEVECLCGATPAGGSLKPTSRTTYAVPDQQRPNPNTAVRTPQGGKGDGLLDQQEGDNRG